MLDDTPVPLGNHASNHDLVNGNGAPVGTYAGFHDARPAASGSSAQITRMISAVMRYKWLLAIFAVAGLGIGLLLRRNSAPVYTAEATVWIQVANEREAARGPIRSGNLFEANAWIDLLRSFTVLDAVVLQQRLYLSGSLGDRSVLNAFSLADRFRPGTYRLITDKSGKRYDLQDGTGVTIESGLVGDSIGRDLGFLWAPRIHAGRELNFTLTTPREAARKLNDRLVTNMRQSGGRQEQNFVRLQLQGADPAAIASVVNAVAERFVEVGAELKRAQLAEVSEILETQRLYAEKNLRDAEIALENFRVHTITLPSDEGTPVAPGLESTQDPVMRNYFEMKIEREQLRRDTEGVRQALSTKGESGSIADALSSVPSTTQSPELSAALTELTNKRAQLRALRQQYTDEHPVVQRLASDIAAHETQTLPKLGTSLLSQLNNRANIIDGWINSASNDLQSIPPRMIEEARLRRNVEIAERLHTNLRERSEEARLATATTIPDVRVLDRATAPEDPGSSSGIQFIAIGLLGGLFAGIGLAILLDRVDGRVRYPDQVTRQLGLPILGALPHVKADRNGKSTNSTAHAIEALREIRLNLAHSVGGQHPLALAITSPGSGDGKTFISCNLALASAGAGKRTLIIDGDTRRGQLHRMLNATRFPGLTDYLLGEATMDAVVQSTEHAGLDFVGSGTRRTSSGRGHGAKHRRTCSAMPPWRSCSAWRIGSTT
jgi:uncharacterized protein involved in exopolysaccharide biosynthesis